MTSAPDNAIAVSARNLRKRFGANEVLRGISLDAHEGDVISILGASGSGKSTLLRCINLLEIPDDGDVVVAGETIALRAGRGGRREPVDRSQVDRIRMQVAMVFQSFNLWSHMTVIENVIEAPVHVQKRPRADALREGWRCSTRSASPTSATPIPRICRAASSSAPRSRGRLPCIRA